MLSERFKSARVWVLADVFMALLIMVIFYINPVEEAGKIVPRAEAMLTVEWDADTNVDFDTWVLFPNKAVLSFKHKDVVLGLLRRDDLGLDVYTSGTEPKIEVKQNLEVVDFIILTDGTYVVNIHYYNAKQLTDPVEVKLDLYVMEPYHKAVSTTLHLQYRGDERTAFSFTVKDGEIVKVDKNAQVILATPGARGA